MLTVVPRISRKQLERSIGSPTMRRTTVLLIAVALVVAGCGGSTSHATGRAHTFRLDGQTDLLVTPTHATNKVVLYVHGAEQTAQTITADPTHAKLATALLKAGYSIAGSDASGLAWGNSASMRDYERLISYLHRRGFSRLYVLAESMGGFDGLQLLSHAHVAAWAALYPACNLRSIYVNPPVRFGPRNKLVQFAPEIRTAYGRTLQAALATKSPVALPHALGGLPMVFWSSPHDQAVPKASNTDVCAARAKQAGANVTVITTSGNHADASNFQPQALLATFARG